MLTKIMKWVSIVALLVAALWPSPVDPVLRLEFAVFAGAILAAQTTRVRKYS